MVTPSHSLVGFGMGTTSEVMRADRVSSRLAAVWVAGTTILLLFAGCSSRSTQGALIPVEKVAEGTSRVTVLAATTRQRSTTDPGAMFSELRSDNVSYASVAVSIPPDGARKIGEVQWPAAPPGDPSRDFVTVSAGYLDANTFARTLTAEIKASKSTKVLVFVHGFNNRFDDAVYRFAQIVHDANTPAIPLLFTWPSRGRIGLRSYTYDRESANFSRDALEDLLAFLDRNPAVSEVDLLAHSMGNWVALEALRSRSIRNPTRPGKLRNVLLVAPDVDVDVFRTQIRRIGTNGPHFFLFVSQDDRALSLSRTIWGDVPRLGDIDPESEPYRSEFEKDRIVVFDLTTLARGGDDAHSRAFEQADTVVRLLRDRLGQGQQLSEKESEQ
jgi:esterase/lipase superfamily enzyme